MISGTFEKPLASWKGNERYGSDLLSCLTIIFKSAGCSYGKCRMCSYRHEKYGELGCDELLARLRGQLAYILNEYDLDAFRMVKIFTSGSFLDPAEVPSPFREDVAKAFRGKLLIVETRPEFIRNEVIRPFIEQVDDGSWKTPLYCAVGLETTHDLIREKCIRKGFSFADFVTAARTAHDAGAGIKAYLLHKPLFLTEKEALDDMHRSIREAADHADIISMNPCTVQKKTELEFYWKRGAYRPPYLWSVLAILADAPVHVTCDPLGGGQKRGPHNCGKCDYDIVKGIREYSLNADRELIRALLETECPCKAEWEAVLENEKPYCMPLTR